MTYKIEEAVSLMNDLSSGIKVIKGKSGTVSTNNLYPLLDIVQEHNLNVVELEKLVSASRFLPDSIYHANAEVNEVQLKKREVLDLSSIKLQERLVNAAEGDEFKIGTNGVFSLVIKDLVNDAFRNRAVQYVENLVDEQIDKMKKQEEKNKRFPDQERFDQLKKELMLDISKPIREYSLFREMKPEETFVDAKSLAKTSVLDSEVFFEKAYSALKESEENELFKKKKHSMKP